MISYKFKVLSLKRREDRRKLFNSRFSNYEFEYFFGLDGREYSLSDYDNNWIHGNEYKNY